MNPIIFLREAVKAVPAVKYALGLGGIISLIAITYSFKLEPRVAFVGTIVTLVFMGVLVVFARMVALAGPLLHLPALFFTWFILILFMATCVALFSSVFFKKPLDLHHWLSDEADPINVRSEEIPLVADSGWRGGGSSREKYCMENLERYKKLYPARAISIIDMKEDHKSEFTPFKHDYYRYQCWFMVK